MGAPLRLDDADGVAIVTFDQHEQRVNLISPAVWHCLDDMLTEIERQFRGAVFISGKDTGFCVGADIGWLATLGSDPTRRDEVDFAHSVIRRMLSFPLPLVAAIDGLAVGGGLELALACHARVASDRESTRLGLPEVTLGLIPGGGGTQLLPRLVGVPSAVTMLLEGSTIAASEALKIGLVDEVCRASALRDAAVDLVRSGAVATSQSLHKPMAFDEKTTDQLLAARPKGLTPQCAEAIREAVLAGLRSGVDEGLRVEADWFNRLCESPEASARLHLFLEERSVAKKARRAKGDAKPPQRIFVIGGGMMGSGIAADAISLGIPARVRDLNDAALIDVYRTAEKVLRHRGIGSRDFSMFRHERIHRLSTTTDSRGIGSADLVIEAVFEDTSLKHQILHEAEPLMKDDAVFASNTSAIPISVIAAKATRPERVIGMHFFSPVHRMKLLEIIPHAGTDPTTVARAFALALELGKLPIMVADSPGFFTSRVYGRWLDEGTRLILDGARIDQIDMIARKFGFPVGPMTAQDEVSISLVQKVATDPMTANITSARVQLGPARMAIDALLAAGHMGRKAGRGWYTYSPDGKRQGPDQTVYSMLDIRGSEVSDEEVRDRIVYSFVTEALLCLDEGIIGSEGDGDVASVLGIGFPRDIGGPFHMMKLVGRDNALEVIRRLDGGSGNFTAPA